VVDQALAQLGRQRTLALTLPQMFAVPAIIASSRMTATVLKRIALSSPTGGKLVLFPPPIALPEIIFHLIWHRRSNGNPAQEWFREMIESVAVEL
jgi:DNA-binding transcriptional LysR family regulator